MAPYLPWTCLPYWDKPLQVGAIVRMLSADLPSWHMQGLDWLPRWVAAPASSTSCMFADSRHQSSSSCVEALPDLGPLCLAEVQDGVREAPNSYGPPAQDDLSQQPFKRPRLDLDLGDAAQPHGFQQPCQAHPFQQAFQHGQQPAHDSAVQAGLQSFPHHYSHSYPMASLPYVQHPEAMQAQAQNPVANQQQQQYMQELGCQQHSSQASPSLPSEPQAAHQPRCSSLQPHMYSSSADVLEQAIAQAGQWQPPDSSSSMPHPHRSFANSSELPGVSKVGLTGPAGPFAVRVAIQQQQDLSYLPLPPVLALLLLHQLMAQQLPSLLLVDDAGKPLQVIVVRT